MYAYQWDPETRGYLLTSEAKTYVAGEMRPVFADELTLTGMNKRFVFDKKETRPLMWAIKNFYYYRGEKVAQAVGTRYGKPFNAEYFFEDKMELCPVDVERMIEKNRRTMTLVVADAKKRAKEQYDQTVKKSDICYIAFSGGKDSVALLDICNQVLPISAPVIYSDTDMELPDSVDVVWENVKKRYPEREFVKVKAEKSAVENWKIFGPPSRSIRWCCHVHKSTPAIMYLKERLNEDRLRAVAFVGVRGEESLSRFEYKDLSYGVKNASQTNCMPILEWGSHELWLYIFEKDLDINPVYRYGLTRVGCLVCPESTQKHIWFISKLYREKFKVFKDVILNTSAKNFDKVEEENEFIANGNWQTRRGGAVLKSFITNPLEVNKGLRVTFKSSLINKDNLLEWIKTVGVISRNEKGTFFLTIPNSREEVLVEYSEKKSVSFTFNDEVEKKSLLPVIRNCLKKIISCVGCRCCEAECVNGAINSINSRLIIDGSKCTKCRICYEIEGSCWRLNSLYMSDSTNSKSISINGYKTFGLRENEEYAMITKLVEMRDNFFPWSDSHPLGSELHYAAYVWFKQAELIRATKDKSPTLLLDLFAKGGDQRLRCWQIIWFNLANNADLMKWFCLDVDFGIVYSPVDLSVKVEQFYYPSIKVSARKGGIASLQDLFKRSPLGVNVDLRGDDTAFLETISEIKESLSYPGAFFQLKGKSKRIERIVRKRCNIDVLTFLYCLYFIAHRTNRTTFTIREMMTTEPDSPYVSPITAFGFDADEFQLQCQNVYSRYPDYISLVFTHGNDEFELYPQKHTLDDIITLILSEN